MITIPKTEFTFRYSRSSGAGGQNVNKVNTKATLTWDMQASESLSSFVKQRFGQNYLRYMTNGKVVIHSERYRSQARNTQDCIDKLHKLLLEVQKPPKVRRATKPSKSAVKKRLENKNRHSSKKRMRTEKF